MRLGVAASVSLAVLLMAGCTSIEIVATYDASGNAQSAPLREVVPKSDGNDPQVTGWETNLGSGMEGSMSFMRAIAADGTLVLDRVIDSNADSQSLPAGTYTLSEYYRDCRGSCEQHLDEAHLVCSVEARLKDGSHYWIAIRARPVDTAPYPDNANRKCTLNELAERNIQ